MKTLSEHIHLASVLFVILTANVQVLRGNQTGRHTYVVRYKYGDSLIPVTVVLDYKRQTEYVLNMNSRTPAKSVTLYDFKERVIAYKDLKNGECFIGRLAHETIQEEDAVLKRLKSPVESQPLILTLEPNRASLTPTEVRNMAGHKAAVFCRRMNIWTLMPEKNKRAKRDTLNHLERASTIRYDEQYPKLTHISSEKDEIPITEQDIPHRNRSDRDFSSYQNNVTFSVTHRKTDHPDTVSFQQPSILDPAGQQQRLNSVYPFILPRQRNVVSKTEEKKGLRQNLNIYNTSRKIIDDSIHRLDFSIGRSKSQSFPEFDQTRSSISGNGSSLLTAGKHAIIPLRTDRPVIIPSIVFPGKFPESKFSEDHDVSQIGAASFPGGYSQNHGNIHTLHDKDEVVEGYPSFPPEAFVLPLTRSSTSTTAPPLLYRAAHNETNDQTNDHHGSLNKSADDFQVILPATSDQTIQSITPLSTESSDSYDISTRTSGVPLQSHNIWNKENLASGSLGKVDDQKPERSFYVNTFSNQVHSIPSYEAPGGAEGTDSETNISSTENFEGLDSSSRERGDIPIEIPRWYPEITKQISIPLEIEVLHHREEYPHGLINGTDKVHSISGHEVEDHSTLSNLNSIIPIPVETYSSDVAYENRVKLLPQVSENGNSLRITLNQPSVIHNNIIGRGLEPAEVIENNFAALNNSLHEPFQHPKDTQESFPTNSSDAKISANDLSPDASLSVVRNNYINPISHAAPSPHHDSVDEHRRNPKGKQHINENTFAVHDIKIAEGLPSYRKRFPAVSQLFSPEETVVDVGRLPDRHFRLSQQSRHIKRRPSASRNKTRLSPRNYESTLAWRKQNLSRQRPRFGDQGAHSFLNRQQTKFGDQGITFHHRGYGKADVSGIPYDHHRKRFGVLPPGVSVHPRHPQAPYANLAVGTRTNPIPVNPLIQQRPRRIHLRHHRRHQRKRNRILPFSDSNLPATNCCGGDGLNCCSSRRRGRFPSKTGCCSQPRESRRPNLVLASQTDENEVSSRKKVEDVAEDRCMKEKMCRTVYQSTKKVFVCRNIEVEGC